MNLRCVTICIRPWLSAVATCCLTVSVLAPWTGAVAADEKETTQLPGQQLPADREPRVPGLGVPGIPAPAPDRRPDKPPTYAPGERNSQTLLGAPPMMEQRQEATSPEALQKRLKELQQQQAEVAKKYEETMRAMQQTLPRAAQIDIDRQQLQWKLAEAQAQIADFSNQQNRIVQDRLFLAPLPENAMLRAFTLKYVKPNEIGEALHNITGGGGPRVAVDERTNALLIAGTDKQISVADQLVQTLDQPGRDQKGKTAETLQLRVVWIVDGLPDTEGKNVAPPYVSPQVLDGLVELGFETPRVMCQQVSMLTFDRNDKLNGGHFNFRLPVLVQGSPWQFEGQGTVKSADDDRFTVGFNMTLRQPEKDDCELTGSIVTPLSHYNVLGTTTFVDESRNSPPGEMEQHLSAFVVYLDHPREFGEKKATEKAR